MVLSHYGLEWFIIQLEITEVKSTNYHISFWLHIGNVIKVTQNRNWYPDQTLQSKTTIFKDSIYTSLDEIIKQNQKVVRYYNLKVLKKGMLKDAQIQSPNYSSLQMRSWISENAWGCFLDRVSCSVLFPQPSDILSPIGNTGRGHIPRLLTWPTAKPTFWGDLGACSDPNTFYDTLKTTWKFPPWAVCWLFRVSEVVWLLFDGIWDCYESEKTKGTILQNICSKPITDHLS